MRAATHRGRDEPYAGSLGEKPDAGFRHSTATGTPRTEQASYPANRKQAKEPVGCCGCCGRSLVRGEGSLLWAEYLLFWRGRRAAAGGSARREWHLLFWRGRRAAA